MIIVLILSLGLSIDQTDSGYDTHVHRDNNNLNVVFTSGLA